MNASARKKDRIMDRTPELREGVRLHQDRLRDEHVLLFPEGVMQLNSTALRVLLLCDGRHDVREIVAKLADTFAASREVIVADVVECLLGLEDRYAIWLSAPEAV